MRMKEILNQKLANLPQTPYSKGGDIFMATEPGQGENPMGVDEATRRLEEAARQGEQRRAETPQTAGAGVPPGGGEPPAPPVSPPEEPEGGNGRPGQPSSSEPEEPQGGDQAEEQRRIQESFQRMENSAPEFAGFSSGFIESLNSRNRDQIQNAYEDIRRRYNDASLRIANDYKDRQYASEEQRKAANDEYRSRIDQLRNGYQDFISAIGERMTGVLEGESNRTLGLRLRQIDELEKTINSIPEDQAEKRTILRGELRDTILSLYDAVPSPEDQPLPNAILEAIGKDDFVAEKFISAMIILPQEESAYRMPGFYSEINMNKFLKINERTLPRDKMERLLNLVKATETLHNMNHILKTSIDQFAQVSQTILSSQLTTVFNIRGVQDVFELYEGIIKENLSIETRITEQVFDGIDEEVEDDFKKRVRTKVPSLKGEGTLEDWEVKRAIIYGRNLVRTLLREAEYISLSNLPEGPARIISLAQGQLFSIFHAVKYTIQKFKPGESRGGIEMLEEVLAEAAEKRRHGRNKEEGKGIVRLSVLQGTGVGDREATKIIGTRGAFMTWRATEATLREFAILDKGIPSNIAQFFLDHEKEIAALKEISSHDAWGSEFKREENKYVVREKDETNEKWEERKKKQLKDWQTTRIERVFGELLKNNATALGVLVSPIPLTIPTEVKQMLWEKIAELNPDVMASILTRFEVDEKAEGVDQLQNVKSLEQILLQPFGTDEQKKLLLVNGEWKPTTARRELAALDENYKEIEGKLARTAEGPAKNRQRAELEKKGKELDAKKREFDILDSQVKQLLRHKDWRTLRGKLRTINRLRMLDETERINIIKGLKKGNPELPKKFEDYLSHKDLSKEDMLDEKERNVVGAISESGKKIAQDLANIQQATIWFLDDVPTDIIKWENLGQFFNRMIGDFGRFSESSNETVQFLANPFQMEMQKALEHQAKAIDAAGQVIGVEVAQDNLNSITTMYNRWIQTYPRYRQKFIEMIASAGHKYTSKAQEVARDTGAPSLDEETMFTTLLTENHMSILRGEKRDDYGRILFTDTFQAAVKDLKVGVWKRAIWANLRDWGPFFLLGLLMQFFKETTADTKR